MVIFQNFKCINSLFYFGTFSTYALQMFIINTKAKKAKANLKYISYLHIDKQNQTKKNGA